MKRVTKLKKYFYTKLEIAEVITKQNETIDKTSVNTLKSAWQSQWKCCCQQQCPTRKYQWGISLI